MREPCPVGRDQGRDRGHHGRADQGHESKRQRRQLGLVRQAGKCSAPRPRPSSLSPRRAPRASPTP
jgi:hypothetical protein